MGELCQMYDDATTLEALREGEIDVVGPAIVGSSNNAMLVTVTRVCDDPEPTMVVDAIYKPVLGERPLDDFPDGTLARREVAAWHVSEESGPGIVPPTEPPRRPCSAKACSRHSSRPIPTSMSSRWLSRTTSDCAGWPSLDAVMNNTDRKGGHILPVDGGRHIYGVDHGVTFSPVPKLRTVLWGWRGDAART